jgi:hypothetical protein
MGATWVGRWEGGRIRVDGKGRRVWVIEKHIAGRTYVISLDVATERESVAALVAFEKNPAAFRAARQRAAPAPNALLLDDALLSKFLAYARREELSEKYIHFILEKYLTEWGAALKGEDLRALTLTRLRQALESWPTARKHRIIAIKALTAWLRTEAALLTTQQDATLDLATMRPPKNRLSRKSDAIGDVEQAYEAMQHQKIRDVILLGAKHGMHQTEIARIPDAKKARLRPVGPWLECKIVGTLTFIHKNGETHTISLDAQSFRGGDSPSA